jgi:NADH:ubiquinone oxidoreductase subunit 3 (subunit A)
MNAAAPVETREKLSVRFYIIAMLFVPFDEAVFMYLGDLDRLGCRIVEMVLSY